MKTVRSSRAWIPAMLIVVWSHAAPGLAEDGRFDLGFRTDIGLGTGHPSNDIPGYSLFGHYGLNERWNIGFGLDHSPAFDFERTPGVLGLETPEVIDAKGASTTFSGWLERVYARPEGRIEWFWNVGLGFSSVDMKDVAGPVVGGGAFDTATDAGSEFLAMVGVGVRFWFGDSWGFEFAIHHDRHFADWKLTDRVSGRTGTVSDYEVNTINVGFLKRF